MNKIYLLLLVSILSTSLFAQKELTLADAILKGRTDLAPDRLVDLKWIAYSQDVSYLSKNREEVIKYSLKEKMPKPIANLKEINKSLGIDMNYIPSISWTMPDNFYFQYQNAFYQYNISKKKGEKIIEAAKGAANVDFNDVSNQMAYTIDNNLYVANAKDNKLPITKHSDPNIVSGQAIARYEFGIGKGIFWSNKGNFLAFYEKDETDVADYPLLDITTTPGSLRSVKYPMAGQKSEYAKIGIYSMNNHSLTYLDIEGPKDQYLTNFAWGPNEQYVYVAVVNRDQNHMWLNQYDAMTGKFVKTLFEEKHAKYVEPENPVWFLPTNPDEFLWLSERDGFMHVYRYSTDGKLLGQLTKGNWLVKNILGQSRSGKNLIVTGSDESGLNTYAYSVNMSSGKTEKLSDNSGTHSYKLSDDGMFLTDVYSSLKTPGVTDIINTRGKKVKNLVASTNPLRDVKVGTIELVDVTADDGTTLHARIIKPSDFNPAKKYPVLVYVYGGPHAQMVSNRWQAGAPLWMNYFAEKGYIIFTLDNRGSSNRGFEFENTIHRRIGTVEIADQMLGVKYLKSLPYVDANRMAVHGWSYGGFMTTAIMLRQPDVFKVGVAGGPVTDWKYYEIMYGERYMDRPEENPKGYEKSSLFSHTKNLKGDLLLIHGTSDDVVVMQHNLALVQQFVQEGTQVDFFPYPMHPHNVRGKDRIHLMTKVLSYVEDKLGKYKKKPTANRLPTNGKKKAQPKQKTVTRKKATKN